MVTYVVDRNINSTNICQCGCRFCAFFKAPGQAGGYTLTREELGRKIEETLALGGRQILLQGGHNPDMGLPYYESLLGFIRETYPDIHVHGFSPPEIVYFAGLAGLTPAEVIARLKAAGLTSIPGGGAEILSDRVRQAVAPAKCSTSEWLDVMRQAHRQGLRTTATMMFGHVETWAERIEHLTALRRLQDETRGFTAFIAWGFQPDNTALGGKKCSPQEYLRVLSLSRLVLDNFANLQASWVDHGTRNRPGLSVPRGQRLRFHHDRGERGCRGGSALLHGRTGRAPGHLRRGLHPAPPGHGLQFRGGLAMRLGRISYLNVLPIYHPLEAGWIRHEFDIVSGPPATLNGLIRSGELDLSACSSIEYARNPQSYYLLPDLAHRQPGPGKERAALKPHPAPRSSRQSRSWSRPRPTPRPRFCASCWKRSTTCARPSRPRPVRSGSPWPWARTSPPCWPSATRPWLCATTRVSPINWTWAKSGGIGPALPFVFGVWVARREAAQADPEGMVRAAALLCEAKRAGVAAIEEVVGLAALSKSKLSRSELRRYFDHLSYDLGAKEQEGLSRFFDCLAEHGIIRESPCLEILSTAPQES